MNKAIVGFLLSLFLLVIGWTATGVSINHDKMSNNVKDIAVLDARFDIFIKHVDDIKDLIKNHKCLGKN